VAIQPNIEQSSVQAPNLHERASKYREAVEKVVHEVGEHPQYEMKRSCSLSKLSEKIEFVKDIQSIATSKIDFEKYMVIGADEATKTFCSVTNTSEFDDASIMQILEKYLSPVPLFEVFRLQTSAGEHFVLIVIPKQVSRRILAKVSVPTDDPKDLKPRLLLREGDLWTKGSSTGKRLAKVEDWDDILNERIESEAEQRARARTAHTIEIALARDKIATSAALIPSVFTDASFQALMEDLCSSTDKASKFALLLERLRDETVEEWHRIGAYEDLSKTISSYGGTNSIPEAQKKVREHITNVLRPAVRWVTLAGIYIVKCSGPTGYFDSIADLLTEIFDSTHSLQMPRFVVPLGQTSQNIEQHISHTVPALESLISLHLIGAYVARRNRFQYLRSLLRGEVFASGWQGQDWKKQVMAFWPLSMNPPSGEPEELTRYGGRITLCAARVRNDSGYTKLFGSERATIDALCQYEFCLELNSFLAIPALSPDTGAYIAKIYPNLDFTFRPDMFAFELNPLHDLAKALFTEIKRSQPVLLKQILFDAGLVSILNRPGSEGIFATFLDSVSKERGEVSMILRRFSASGWPLDLAKELTLLREAKAKKVEPTS